MTHVVRHVHVGKNLSWTASRPRGLAKMLNMSSSTFLTTNICPKARGPRHWGHDLEDQTPSQNMFVDVSSVEQVSQRSQLDPVTTVPDRSHPMGEEEKDADARITIVHRPLLMESTSSKRAFLLSRTAKAALKQKQASIGL